MVFWGSVDKLWIKLWLSGGISPSVVRGGKVEWAPPLKIKKVILKAFYLIPICVFDLDQISKVLFRIWTMERIHLGAPQDRSPDPLVRHCFHYLKKIWLNSQPSEEFHIFDQVLHFRWSTQWNQVLSYLGRRKYVDNHSIAGDWYEAENADGETQETMP